METHKDRILVVDDNKLILKLVEERLRAAGFEVQTAGSAEVAQEVMLETGLPDLIILDVMMPGMDGYQFCRLLKSEAPTTSLPVLMLTARGDIQEKIKGFEAGADDYLVKPFEAAELIARTRALLARTRAAQGERADGPHLGRVISVFSLRGGVGRSTMAVNLAVSLAGLWDIEVGLIDLALESDQDAMMLNLRPKLTWSGLADKDLDHVDEDLVDGHLTKHPSGVKLLAAPTSPVLAGLVTPKLIGRVLTMLRRKMEYLVIDLAPTFAEQTLTALDLSDLIVLMLTPELASLKAARTALDIFESLGYEKEKITAVLNHTFLKGSLPEKNIESALAVPIDLLLTYEPAAFVNAVNTGIPVVIDQPQMRASLEIQKFAYQISAIDMRERSDLPNTEMFQRVKGALGR